MTSSATDHKHNRVCDASPCQRWFPRYFSADAYDDPNPQPPEIVIVAAQVSSPRDIAEVLRHELTHARDHCEKRRDLRVCDELACSEIKAHLAAECSENGSRIAGVWSCSRPALWISPARCEEARAACVRRYAVRATSNVFAPAEARTCVDRVFDRCYAQGWPEAEPPRPQQP